MFVYDDVEEGKAWQDAIWHAVIARVGLLPERIGSESTDNGHGKGMATRMNGGRVTDGVTA